MGWYCPAASSSRRPRVTSPGGGRSMRTVLCGCIWSISSPAVTTGRLMRSRPNGTGSLTGSAATACRLAAPEHLILCASADAKADRWGRLPFSFEAVYVSAWHVELLIGFVVSSFAASTLVFPILWPYCDDVLLQQLCWVVTVSEGGQRLRWPATREPQRDRTTLQTLERF